MKMKHWKRLLILGLTVTTIGMAADCSSVEAKAQIDGFNVQGHRGARDLRAENTLPAFATAMEIGVTQIELDTNISQDGVVVISHNATLDPLVARDKNGEWIKEENKVDVRKVTVAEAKQFDIGGLNPSVGGGGYYKLHGQLQKVVPHETMPTLEEVFKLVKAYNSDVIVNIELKSYPDRNDPRAHGINTPPDIHVAKVLELINKYNMQDQVTLQSFDWRIIQEVRRQNKDIMIGALTCEQPKLGQSEVYRQVGQPGCSPWMAGLDIDDFNGDYVEAAHALNVDYVAPIQNEVTPELVAKAHSLGMKLVPWTVNNPTDMETMIDMGVDGLISDRPDLVREVCAKRGIELPVPAKKPSNLQDLFPNSINW